MFDWPETTMTPNLKEENNQSVGGHPKQCNFPSNLTITEEKDGIPFNKKVAMADKKPRRRRRM